MDDLGILRLGGGLQISHSKFEQKHPCIPPSDDKFSELLVRKSHQQVMDSGLQDTINQVRERFWTLRGRQLTKRTVNACLLCRKHKAKPAQQISALLPKPQIAICNWCLI